MARQHRPPGSFAGSKCQARVIARPRPDGLSTVGAVARTFSRGFTRGFAGAARWLSSVARTARYAVNNEGRA